MILRQRMKIFCQWRRLFISLLILTVKTMNIFCPITKTHQFWHLIQKSSHYLWFLSAPIIPDFDDSLNSQNEYKTIESSSNFLCLDKNKRNGSKSKGINLGFAFYSKNTLLQQREEGKFISKNFSSHLILLANILLQNNCLL